jgi:phosphoglycolate phosphatase
MIMARMRLEPGQVMMVGDSAVDVQTGLNAGMLAIGVTWGFRDRAELIDAGANYLIDRPEDLLALI